MILIVVFSLSIFNIFEPKNLAQSVKLLTCNREMPVSNLAHNTDSSRYFLQPFRQVRAQLHLFNNFRFISHSLSCHLTPLNNW